VKRSCHACYKCLFTPLLGSLLSFLPVIFCWPSILLFLCSLRVCDLLSPLRLAPGPLSGRISALSDHMGKSRTGFFDRARKNGSRQDRSGINGAQVHKSLEDGTKRRYKDAYRLWLECTLCLPLPYFLELITTAFVKSVTKTPSVMPTIWETLKDFVQEVGYGMDGVKGEHDPPSLKASGRRGKILRLNFDGAMIPSPNTSILVTNISSPSLAPPVLCVLRIKCPSVAEVSTVPAHERCTSR
jgi:hypothetical protein